MTDFTKHTSGLDSPGEGSFVVTPHDDNDPATPARSLYCEEAGDVAFIGHDGAEDTWAVPANYTIPIRVTRVKATGTTVGAGTLHAII